MNPTQIYTIPTPNPIPLHMNPNPESNPDSDSDSSFDSDSGFGIAPGLLISVTLWKKKVFFMTEVNGCVTWEMMQMYILQLEVLND